MSLSTQHQQNGFKSVYAVSVGTSSSVLLAGPDGNRMAVEIYNAGSNPLYIGPNSGVSSSNGRPVAAAGGSLTDTLSADAWYGISTVGSNDVRVTVVTKVKY